MQVPVMVTLSSPHFVPASFSDDHLGADLMETLPQLGALQIYTDLPARAAVALHWLAPLSAGLSLPGP